MIVGENTIMAGPISCTENSKRGKLCENARCVRNTYT